jgi:hypothetical protein
LRHNRQHIVADPIPEIIREWDATWYIQAPMEQHELWDLMTILGDHGIGVYVDGQRTGRFTVQSVDLAQMVRIDGQLISRSEWERLRSEYSEVTND